jgi:hypothetical protein
VIRNKIITLKYILILKKLRQALLLPAENQLKKKDSGILPSSAIRIIKKKIKFKKRMTAPKIPRFNKYI